MSTPLSADVIKQLLKEDTAQTLKSRFPPTPQRGPLRFHDDERRCTSRGCGSPTYIKVDHISYCMMHALQVLNQLCITLTDRYEAALKGSTIEGEL